MKNINGRLCYLVLNSVPSRPKNKRQTRITISHKVEIVELLNQCLVMSDIELFTNALGLSGL